MGTALGDLTAVTNHGLGLLLLGEAARPSVRLTNDVRRLVLCEGELADERFKLLGCLREFLCAGGDLLG
jgi:hypothetical protein